MGRMGSFVQAAIIGFAGLAFAGAAIAHAPSPPAPAHAPRTPAHAQPTPAHAQPTPAHAPPTRAQAQPNPAQPIEPGQVLAHVRQTVDWYHQVQDIERLPDLAQDIFAHDRLQQSALSVVQQGFAFGQASAALLESAPQSGATPAPGAQASLNEALARAAARVTALQSQLKDIDSKLPRARRAVRTQLNAQRDDVNAALDLEREVQSTIEELQRFQTSTLNVRGQGAADLQGQLQDLERSVPEVRPPAGSTGATGAANARTGAAGTPGASGSTTRASTAAAAASTAGFQPESAGIIALIGEWFSLESASRQLSGVLGATDALGKGLEALRAPLLQQARGLVGTQLTGLDSTNLAELQNARQSLASAATRFKALATLLIPLGEQDFVMDDARGALKAWRSSVDARRGTIVRYLVMHLAVLCAWVAVVLIVSEIWRRATFKYLRDTRRRSQFQTLRRVAVGIALVGVLSFGLVSQLGSLATYAGFLTAGLAVALQNVILSIVAYFFLIGRYGVRAGDRITLAGVTGRVVDIGLIRLYLMELGGADLHPTGRVVVLSNSVLFQPQALFKQIPGADYFAHTVSVTLAANVDLQAARERLKAAADTVYEEYRESLEQQHAAAQRLAGFETSLPRPDVRVGYAGDGLQFDVRYPVQDEHAAPIDQKMLRAIREALTKEPKLPVTPSGEPTFKRAEA